MCFKRCVPLLSGRRSQISRSCWQHSCCASLQAQRYTTITLQRDALTCCCGHQPMRVYMHMCFCTLVPDSLASPFLYFGTFPFQDSSLSLWSFADTFIACCMLASMLSARLLHPICLTPIWISRKTVTQLLCMVVQVPPSARLLAGCRINF